MKLTILSTFMVLAIASSGLVSAVPYENKIQEIISKYGPEVLNKYGPQIQAFIQQEVQKYAQQYQQLIKPQIPQGLPQLPQGLPQFGQPAAAAATVDQPDQAPEPQGDDVAQPDEAIKVCYGKFCIGTG